MSLEAVDDNLDQIVGDFANISVESAFDKRSVCEKCERPSTVCWCPYVTPVPTKSKLLLLQHPSEEKKCLRTAKILELSLSFSKCDIVKGKRFTSQRHSKLREALQQADNTLLLYPGSKSELVECLPKDRVYTIIIIDGTWPQSRSIYHNSQELHSLRKVRLECSQPSSYVIRTQPSDSCLSTVESAAMILSHVENDETIYDRLICPLNQLCNFQMSHGAVKHESKQYLISHGLYKKDLTKQMKHKLFNKNTNSEKGKKNIR